MWSPLYLGPRIEACLSGMLITSIPFLCAWMRGYCVSMYRTQVGSLQQHLARTMTKTCQSWIAAKVLNLAVKMSIGSNFPKKNCCWKGDGLLPIGHRTSRSRAILINRTGHFGTRSFQMRRNRPAKPGLDHRADTLQQSKHD